MNPTCSIIQQATDTATQPIGFREALQGVRDGRWAEQVQAVQTAFAAGGKKAADTPKKHLPGILFSGTFRKRSIHELIQHSGLICVDLDNLGNAAAATKEQVASDAHTLAAFVSPTGAGLKVIFRIPEGADHADAYRAAEQFVFRQFGLEIDQACKDVCRICFVSHDPELFEAPDAEPLPAYCPPVEHVPSGVNPRTGLELTPGDDYDNRGDLRGLLLKHQWTQVGKHGWRRPDKGDGISATFDKVPGRFYVFSSSTQFTQDHTYRPWHVYAVLEHGGDYVAAARQLGKDGFGTQREKATETKTRQEANLERAAGPAPAAPDYRSKRITLASKPTEPVTRLFLAGKPIATPGNLVSLISKAKTGKTATIGGVVAAIIAAHYDRHDLDTLGFTAPHTKEAVILIDTEQSPFDAYTCHKRAFARAAQDADVDWMHHYALVGQSSKQLRDTLPQILRDAKTQHGQVFTIILDGVADFVASVNDEAECNEFITWLRGLAVEYDCPIICVIHSNEAKLSGDDGRGHLGKQLTRKAESNLLLKKVGEITQITSEKQRKAPITEADGIAFRWSDEYQRHVTVNENEIPEAASKSGRKAKYDYQAMLGCLKGPTEEPETEGIILKRIGTLPCGISPRQFKDVLAGWIDNGEVERVPHPVLKAVYRRSV